MACGSGLLLALLIWGAVVAATPSVSHIEPLVLVGRQGSRDDRDVFLQDNLPKSRGPVATRMLFNSPVKMLQEKLQQKLQRQQQQQQQGPAQVHAVVEQARSQHAGVLGAQAAKSAQHLPVTSSGRTSKQSNGVATTQPVLPDRTVLPPRGPRSLPKAPGTNHTSGQQQQQQQLSWMDARPLTELSAAAASPAAAAPPLPPTGGGASNGRAGNAPDCSSEFDPARPDDFVAVPQGSDQLLLSWKNGDPSACVDLYRLDAYELRTGDRVLETTTSLTSYSLKGLRPDTEYAITVYAVNAVTDSKPATAMATTCAAAAGAVLAGG